MSELTRVALVINDYLCCGHLATGGHRILDVLDDALTEFLSLSDVEICGLGNESLMSSAREAVVRKDDVHLVMPVDDKHEAAGRRWYTFTEKQSRPVLVIAGAHAIRGLVHFRGSFDPVAMQTNGPGRFLPVTCACVTSAGRNLSAAVVFVNRRFISLVTVEGGPASDRMASIPAGDGRQRVPEPAQPVEEDKIDKMLDDLVNRLNAGKMRVGSKP